MIINISLCVRQRYFAPFVLFLKCIFNNTDIKKAKILRGKKKLESTGLECQKLRVLVHNNWEVSRSTQAHRSCMGVWASS